MANKFKHLKISSEMANTGNELLNILNEHKAKLAIKDEFNTITENWANVKIENQR